MPDLAAALEGALDDPGPIPSTGAGLLAYVGGRRALTEQLAGMSGPPRKSDYASPESFAAASRRWRSASRRAQRADPAGKVGKQRRATHGLRLEGEQRERVEAAATRRKWGALVRNGARMRIRGRVRVDTPRPGKKADTRVRELPAGGPGVYISPEQLIPVLELVDDGEDEQASFDLLVAFGESYGFDALDVEEVDSLTIWPEGSSEPG